MSCLYSSANVERHSSYAIDRGDTCDRPLRRCINLLRRRHLRNALFDALRQLSGTHCRKLFSVVTLLQFFSLGLIHSSSLGLSLLSLLTNTLSVPSASEVTTLWRYTNLFIIIIIIIIWSGGDCVLQFQLVVGDESVRLQGWAVERGREQITDARDSVGPVADYDILGLRQR